MPIDARIPLAVNQVDLPGSLSKGLALNENIENRPKRNELLDLQINNQRVQGEQRQRELEFDSVLQGALGLDAIIGADGEVTLPKAQQAMSFLDSRVRDIESRGGVADDTQEAIQFLQQGDFDSLRDGINNVKRVALQTGKLKASSVPAVQQNLIAAGLRPGTPEFQQALLTSINKPGVQVSIGDEAEGTERKEIAKVRARQFEKLSNDADNAESTLASLDQLDAVDAKTGAFEPAKAAVAAVAEGFGFDASAIANVTTAQALEGLSNRLVNDVLNTAKGPQTEGDAQRARSTLKSLGDDPRAGQFKSDSLRAVALRTVEQRDFIDQKIDAGSTFSSARADWNKFKRDTPSLSDVVKNPNTGLPLFYYQFKQSARQRRPDITEEDIINAWRKVHGGS
jgi:hypothetical protein